MRFLLPTDNYTRPMAGEPASQGLLLVGPLEVGAIDPRRYRW